MKIRTLAVCLLLAACGGTNAFGVGGGSSADPVKAWLSDIQPLMTKVQSHVTDLSIASGANDTQGALTQAESAVRDITDAQDVIGPAPTHGLQDAWNYFLSTCKQAYQDTARGMSDLDASEIDISAAEVRNCTAAVDAFGAAIVHARTK